MEIVLIRVFFSSQWRNCDLLHFFQIIKGQQTSWENKAVIPFIEKSLDGRIFVVLSYASAMEE